MIPIKQLTLLSLLVCGATAVWVPSVRAYISGEAAGQTEASAPIDWQWADGSGPAMDIEGTQGVALDPGAVASNIGSGSGSSTANQVDAGAGQDLSAGILRNFGARTRTLQLGPKEQPQTSEPEPEADGRLIRLWVMEHALTGIMQSPSGNRALFGGGFYREGQELSQGWTIETILEQSVELRRAEHTYIVRLPRLGVGPFGRSTRNREALDPTGIASVPEPSNTLLSEKK